MKERLIGALKAIKGVKIPDLPKEIMELNDELSGKFPNSQTITTIIEKNTKLSGEVLRIANCPSMKLKNTVVSIREAVDSLGCNNLKNMVVSAALTNMFNTPKLQEIMDHSTEVAFCCAELSEHIHDVTRDEAYLIGLFHNGGALLLASKDPDNYEKMFSQINTNPVTAIRKEFETYGATHTDIGILLGQKWKLPVEMLNTIMMHHMAQVTVGREKVRAMIAMLKIANTIVNELSYGAYMAQEAKDYMQSGVDELMLSEDDVNNVRRSLLGAGF